MATVWEAAGGREPLTPQRAYGPVGSVSWSPDGTRLATGSDDGTAKVWDAAGGRELLTLKGPAGGPVSWSPDGARLATGSGMARRRCGTRPAAALLTLKGHTGPVGSVSWSPDGTRLATGVRMGRRRCGTQPAAASRLTLKGHTRRGRFRVLVAGRDAAGDGEWGWHGEGVGRGRRPRAAHPQGAYRRVNSVSWSPDGTRLATRSLMARRSCGTRPAAGSRSPSGAYGPGRVRVLVAGRDAAGDGESRWHGEGVGSGWRTGTAHPRGHAGRSARVLVAGRDALATGSAIAQRGVGSGRRPRTAASRGIRAWSFRVLVAGRGGWQRGVGMARRRCGGGWRTGAAHPQGAYERGPFRVLVAGRDAAGDGE